MAIVDIIGKELGGRLFIPHVEVKCYIYVVGVKELGRGGSLFYWELVLLVDIITFCKDWRSHNVGGVKKMILQRSILHMIIYEIVFHNDYFFA